MCHKVIFLMIVLAVHNLVAILQLKITHERDIAFEGNPVNLQCVIYPTKVAPTEELTWKHNGKVLNATNTLNTANTILINKVKLGDAGVYSCSNDLAESMTSLVVIKPTRIVNWAPAIEMTAGSSFKIHCDVEGDSRLKIDIAWFNGKNKQKPIENDDHFVIENDSLTISNVSTLDIGDYICEASTVVDKTRATVKLTLDEVPHAPILNEIKCHDSPSSVELSPSVEISWSPSENYGPDIESFTILFNTALAPHVWHTAKENIPSNVSTSEISSLKPWTKYTYRVIANNKIGQSPPSEISAVCATKPDVPYKNPEKIKVEGTAPNNLVISWKQMPKTVHNGPDFFYRVSWKRDIEFEKWIETDVHDWKQGNIIINNQPTFVRYLAKVEAFNSIGKSNVNADEYFGFSAEGAPFQAPSNLQLADVNRRFALLQWEPVPFEYFNGFYKGYKVKIWNDIDGVNNVTEMHFVAPTISPGSNLITAVKLPALRPATHNYVQVCVLNRKYEGPFSDVIEFTTLEDVPSIVQSFKAIPFNTTALFLRWEKPTNPNGNLTGYNIYCDQIDGGTTKSSDASKQQQPLFWAGPNATAAFVTDLKPDTKYRIAISARTAAGEGERAINESKTKSDQGTQPPSNSTMPSTETTTPGGSSSTSGNVMLIIGLVTFMVTMVKGAF
ncbi:neuroglian-like [Sitodiplosis mosellana]|uniref:neuroglian-like n=1 Tax=Sitodiplosis mosellana TaxID=263140 RepID=UPI002444658E|nr:neuroglian-like [Sitodiplosis mosellana]